MTQTRSVPLLLTINAGSSSLKFALYEAAEPLADACFRGAIRQIGDAPYFDLLQSPDGAATSWKIDASTPEEAIAELMAWLGRHPYHPVILAAGHRVVHGGSTFDKPVLLNRKILQQLESLSPLAPLHMPHNLAGVKSLWQHLPDLPQVACFDTAFHWHMPPVEHEFAIPRSWRDLGIQRYGFHGLSYEYIAQVLPEYLGQKADGRIIVAHLGSGASLCALHRRRSIATTMSFTPLDGIPMATRPGQLDPGALLYLRQQGFDDKTISQGLNHESGLLGLSGISGDIRSLLTHSDPTAQLAVKYFVHHTHRAIGSLAAALGGLDALIFTAGIGENSAFIRQQLCEKGAWLGLELDPKANEQGQGRISPGHSIPSVWVIPTNEELMVARHTLHLTQELLLEQGTPT